MLIMILIAFCAGVLGSLIGGTQVFVLYGIAGIIGIVLELAGLDITLYNLYLMNCLFLPCVIFNGDVVACAYASKYHDIKGYQTGRSLAFTNDPRVLILGGIAGVIGFLFVSLENFLQLPIDTGALCVLFVGIITRFLFYKGENIHKRNLMYLKRTKLDFWLFHILSGFVFSVVAAILIELTGFVMLGFYISAACLLFGFFDIHLPCSHHTTLVAGYAIMQTHNLALAVLFGIIAHLISLVFTLVCNSEQGTHIDPPAVAIAVCSLFIFAWL